MLAVIPFPLIGHIRQKRSLYKKSEKEQFILYDYLQLTIFIKHYGGVNQFY